MTVKVGKLSYDKINILGQGNFGTVFSGVYFLSKPSSGKTKSMPVAIKRLELSRIDQFTIKREVGLMKKAGDCNHPNILRCFGTETNADFLFIATELCSGTLEEYINGTYKGTQFESEREILRQITQGLAHLHELEIVHRDMKPTNILVFVPSLVFTKSEPMIKLADFGISKILKIDQEDFTNTSLTAPKGTRGWMPPEVFKEERFDFKVDVWAIGCIFAYTLSGGKHPFGDDLFTRLDRIRKEEAMLLVQEDLKKPYSENTEAFKLIQSMLAAEPKNRPSITEVVKNSFLKHENSTAEFLSVCKMFQYSTTTENIGQFKELIRDDRVNVNAITITQYGEEMSPLLLLLCRYYDKIYDKQMELVKDLLLHGADVNAKANKVKMAKYHKIFTGLTTLHLLFGCCSKISNSIIDIVKLLVKYGADVNAEDDDGYSPLHYLCFYYQKDNLIDIIQFLIENGANINVKDKDGWTPLHYLCSNYNKDNLMGIVQLAIENGADANAKDKNGETPLHFLCKFSDLECRQDLKNVAHLLIHNGGAQINDMDENGDTPFHHLCKIIIVRLIH